jgi:ATP-dependent Clp protease ATP-binding subunit ClpC
VGVLPRLDVRFYFHAEDELRPLVAHTVREVFQGAAPRQLEPYLPPRWLRVVTERAQERRRRAPPEAPPRLAAVADAVAHLRGRFSRPYGREAEGAAVAARLGREGQSLLLVGESGCGKTALLVAAARELERRGEGGLESGSASGGIRLSRSSRGEGRAGRIRLPRLWRTSAARLIAGMRYLGQWEERCEEVVGEVRALGGILCLENLLDTVTTGGESPAASIAAFLLPFLQAGELRLVAEATPREVDACRRLLPGLVERFDICRLAPFDGAAAVAALESIAAVWAQSRGVAAERGVAELAARLFARFEPYAPLPGKAAEFLGELLEEARRDGEAAVTLEGVIRGFTARSGIAPLFLRDDLTVAREEVRAAFAARVVGQRPACDAVARLICRFKAGLNDPARPVGVLLFCGPTGVGKTQLARTLAQYCFGHGSLEVEGGEGEREAEGRLLRLDMSEYATPGAAARLLSDGAGGPSELVERLRRQPFRVLLLDEIEKASPEVFDVLLTVFDEGRLTDDLGRLTTFSSAVIVMTSNLGARRGEALGFCHDVGDGRSPADGGARVGAPAPPIYEEEAMRFFRPEFVNRLDEIVTFTPLSAATVAEIARQELDTFARREGLARRGLSLRWDDSLVRLLTRRGFDAEYGARPLQRALEELVAAPLARFLLAAPGARDATILAAVAGEEVTFAFAPPP